MNSKKSGSFINTQINPQELNETGESHDVPFTFDEGRQDQKRKTRELIMKPNLSFFVEENDSDPV